MEISVTDFSTPIGASVFKFCVHLQEGKVYCVNGNQDANAHFAFFFQIFIFSFFLSYIIQMDIFSVKDLYPRYEVYRGYIVFAFSVQEGKVYC